MIHFIFIYRIIFLTSSFCWGFFHCQKLLALHLRVLNQRYLWKHFRGGTGTVRVRPLLNLVHMLYYLRRGSTVASRQFSFEAVQCLKMVENPWSLENQVPMIFTLFFIATFDIWLLVIILMILIKNDTHKVIPCYFMKSISFIAYFCPSISSFRCTFDEISLNPE